MNRPSGCQENQGIDGKFSFSCTYIEKYPPPPSPEEIQLEMDYKVIAKLHVFFQKKKEDESINDVILDDKTAKMGLQALDEPENHAHANKK